MEERLELDKQNLTRVVEDVGRAEDPFFAELEKEMQDFLHRPANQESPEFEQTRQDVLSQERKEKYNPKTHDVLRTWEEDNADYQLKYINEQLKVNNVSGKEISLEFVDYLLGNFFTQNTIPELIVALGEIQETRVFRITPNNNCIVMGIRVKDGRAIGLIFVDAPEFKLKIAELNKHIYSF